MGLRHHDEETALTVSYALTQIPEDGSFDRFVADNLQADAAMARDSPGDTSFLADATSAAN